MAGEISHPRIVEQDGPVEALYLQALEEKSTVLSLFAAVRLESGSLEQRIVVRAEELETLIGDRVLSKEEELRRERQRERSTGISEFSVFEGIGGVGVAIPVGGDLYVVQNVLEKGSMKCLVRGDEVGGAILDLRVCGGRIGFVAGGKLWKVEGNMEDRGLEELASVESVGGGATLVATADYLSQEELDRYEGYWFSPGGTYAVLQITDERDVEKMDISIVPVRKGEDFLRQRSESHAFPYVHSKNPRVGLALVEMGGDGLVRLVRAFESEDHWIPEGGYLARVAWLSSDVVLAVVLTRDQQTVRVVRFSGREEWRPRLVLCERAPEAWVNIAEGAVTVVDEKRFVWLSECSGYRHAYLCAVGEEEEGSSLRGGKERFEGGNNIEMGEGAVIEKVLTQGQWVVDAVVAVQREGVFLLGNADSPLRRRLVFASFDGVMNADATPCGLAPCDESGDLFRPGPDVREWGIRGSQSTIVGMEDEDLAAMAWISACTIGRNGSLAIVSGSSSRSPPQSILCSLTLSRPAVRVRPLATLHKTPVPASGVPDVTYTCFPNADGSASLFAMLYNPPSSASSPPPLALRVYGGPHIQFVRDMWAMAADPKALAVAAKGALVVRADNRGSWNRGRTFEAAVRCRLGELETQDQAAVVETLTAHSKIDPSKVVVSGWSYGGFLSLSCLARRPDLFTAAVVGAPVTHWALYDTCYTERYMGLAPEPYNSTDLLPLLSDTMKPPTSASPPRLLLLHGLRDENVLFAHTARVLARLQELQVPHEFVLLPGERHGPRDPGAAAYAASKMASFEAQHLKI